MAGANCQPKCVFIPRVIVSVPPEVRIDEPAAMTNLLLQSPASPTSQPFVSFVPSWFKRFRVGHHDLADGGALKHSHEAFPHLLQRDHAADVRADGAAFLQRD